MGVAACCMSEREAHVTPAQQGPSEANVQTKGCQPLGKSYTADTVNVNGVDSIQLPAAVVIEESPTFKKGSVAKDCPVEAINKSQRRQLAGSPEDCEDFEALSARKDVADAERPLCEQVAASQRTGAPGLPSSSSSGSSSDSSDSSDSSSDADQPGKDAEGQMLEVIGSSSTRPLTSICAKTAQDRLGDASTATLPDPMPDIPAAKSMLLKLWSDLLDASEPCTTEEWPSISEDYSRLLGNPEQDVYPPGSPLKKVSAQGAVCLIRIEWFEHGYTGLFQRADYGLARMSSALPSRLAKPGCPFFSNGPGTLSESVVMPFVALKMFRAPSASGSPSDVDSPALPGTGNLLFGGRKTGQKENDYFTHCLASHTTERCSMGMMPVLYSLRRYSDYPTHIGLSDFASHSQDGTAVPAAQVRFPWVLLLRPALPSDSPHRSAAPINFLQQLAALPTGTRLYEILACDSPALGASGPMRHIGDVITCTPFVESALERRLRFRHQIKEEDYKMRPQWLRELTPAHQDYGWEHFSKLPVQ